MKRIRNVVLLILAVFFVAMAGVVTYNFFFSTRSAPKAKAPVSPVVQTSVGMELRGCQQKNIGGWLRNTNECSVLIRGVAVSANAGELTMWMREVKPGESVKIDFQTALVFYIYNTAGGLVGFVSGDCPPLSPKK